MRYLSNWGFARILTMSFLGSRWMELCGRSQFRRGKFAGLNVLCIAQFGILPLGASPPASTQTRRRRWVWGRGSSCPSCSPPRSKRTRTSWPASWPRSIFRRRADPRARRSFPARRAWRWRAGSWNLGEDAIRMMGCREDLGCVIPVFWSPLSGHGTGYELTHPRANSLAHLSVTLEKQIASIYFPCHVGFHCALASKLKYNHVVCVRERTQGWPIFCAARRMKRSVCQMKPHR